MDRDKDIEKQYSFSNKQVMGMIAGVAFSVFSLTTIYNKFLFNEEQIITNIGDIELLEEVVGTKASNERLDKKTLRIEGRLTDLEETVKHLAEPDSDKSPK